VAECVSLEWTTEGERRCLRGGRRVGVVIVTLYACLLPFDFPVEMLGCLRYRSILKCSVSRRLFSKSGKSPVYPRQIQGVSSKVTKGTRAEQSVAISKADEEPRGLSKRPRMI
jgi:hypothetical protein